MMRKIYVDHQCVPTPWLRYMDVGQPFYDGMSPSMKQLLETLCGGDFLKKNPDEAMDFLNYGAETSKAWDEPKPGEIDTHRPLVNQKGGIFSL